MNKLQKYDDKNDGWMDQYDGENNWLRTTVVWTSTTTRMIEINSENKDDWYRVKKMRTTIENYWELKVLECVRDQGC